MAASTVERRRPRIEGVINLRSSHAFRDWLPGVARSRKATMTDTIAHGVVALAKAEGFKPEAPRS